MDMPLKLYVVASILVQRLPSRLVQRQASLLEASQCYQSLTYASQDLRLDRYLEWADKPVEPYLCSLAHILTSQVVCLDKLDYVASRNNLADVLPHPNFKVIGRSWTALRNSAAVRALLTLLSYLGDPASADSMFPLAQFIKGDIQSVYLLRYVMETEDIDTVMHFAAQVCDHMLFNSPS